MRRRRPNGRSHGEGPGLSCCRGSQFPPLSFEPQFSLQSVVFLPVALAAHVRVPLVLGRRLASVPRSRPRSERIDRAPLPATLPLFAGGLGFVGYLTGRKKRKAGQARWLPHKPIDKPFRLMQTRPAVRLCPWSVRSSVTQSDAPPPSTAGHFRQRKTAPALDRGRKVHAHSAVHMTAGHNALRGSGPGQFPAFENAMALVGCPDRRIDWLCITCSSPSQPSHHANGM
jgi:hypothetical protein